MPAFDPTKHVPELAVACPQCHAPPGRKCRRPSGHSIFGGGSHASREKRLAESKEERDAQP